jgi:hypothetical protein
MAVAADFGVGRMKIYVADFFFFNVKIATDEGY